MDKEYTQTTIRIEKNLLKEYKKWLIDKGYKSINQHLNEMIRKALKEDNRLPPEFEEERSYQ